MTFFRDPQVPRRIAIVILLLTLATHVFARMPEGPEFARRFPPKDLAPEESFLPTIILFKASWCPSCYQVEHRVIPSAEVLALADRFHWVALDIDRNLELAREWQVSGVPVVLILDTAGREKRRFVAPDSAAAFAEQLRAYLGGRTAPDPHREEQDSRLVWTPRGYRSMGLCFAHVGYGPLHLASQSPLQSIRWSMLPRTPSTLGKGQYQVYSGASWVNVWVVEEDLYELDYEALLLHLELAYGITNHLSIEVEFQDRSMFGGKMDGFIRNFHDFFGIDQNGRDEVTPDRFHGTLTFDGYPPIVLDSADRGSVSRTLQVTLLHNITCGTQYLPALSYAVAARYETLDWTGTRGPGGVDLGLSLALSQRFGSVYLYATLGYAHFGTESMGRLDLRSEQFSVLLAGEWSISPRHALIINLLQTEGVARDYGAFSDPSTEVSLGWKWELLPNTVFELGLVENILAFDNSPDFGVHLGLSRRF